MTRLSHQLTLISAGLLVFTVNTSHAFEIKPGLFIGEQLVLGPDRDTGADHGPDVAEGTTLVSFFCFGCSTRTTTIR